MSKSAESAGSGVVDINADECVGDFLAVGADVLNWCCTGETGDFRKGFDAGKAFIYAILYDIIPVFAAHDLEP